MASLLLTDCKFLVGGFDLSGQTNSGSLTLSRTEKDATTFGSGGSRERKAGMLSGALNLDAFFDSSTASAIDPVLDANLGVADTVVTVAPTTGLAGEVAYSFKSRQLELGREFMYAELGKLSASALSTGALLRGTILEDSETARIASGSSSAGTTLGSVSASQSVYAALHVLSVSGTGSPTLTVRVQSDDNAPFASPVNRISFSAATAVGSQFASAAGAITDTIWRVDWTISGTTPSFTFLVVVGIF